MAAETEQLEAVGVDPESALALDLANRDADPGVVDLGRPAAARADHVMMVGRRTRDIGVLAGRQIQALDDAQLDEELERAEQGCPADPEAPVAGGGGELEDREMAVMAGDQVGDRKPRCGQAIAGGIESSNDRIGGIHGIIVPGSRPSVKTQSQ